MDRRQFLTYATLATAGTLTGQSASADLWVHFYQPPIPIPTIGLSILQGYTTESETQLSVCLGAFENVIYELKDKATQRVIPATTIKQVKYRFHQDRVDKLKYSGLELGHRYELTVFSRTQNKIVDRRSLSTVDLNKANPRIGLMACMKDFLVLEETKTAMWAAAEESNLDYLFFLGDTVYGDALIIHGPNFLWERYMESRKSIPFYRWKNLKPVLATWDDHDFGKNDADGHYSYKSQSLSHFKTFFAQESDRKHLFKGYGNSFLFRAFGQNFAFFDNRFFRGFVNAQNEKTFMGRKQIDWMMNGLKKRPAPTLVMNGAPMFGRSEKGSSYQTNAPQELQYFLSSLKSTQSPAVFVGGDLHYSEFSKIDRRLLGYDTVEMIVGCMHSNTKTAFYDNVNPRIAGTLKESFVILERPAENPNPVWETACITAGSRVAFRNKIQLS